MTIHPKLKDFFSHIYLALEWRVIATFITFIAALIISGDAKISLGIASVESVAKIVVQSFWLKHRVKKQQV
jgi:uncharacterized membrane protein